MEVVKKPTERVVYSYSKPKNNNPKRSRIGVAGIINYEKGEVRVNAVQCPQRSFNKSFVRRVAVERIHNNRENTPTQCRTFSDPKEAGIVFRELAAKFMAEGVKPTTK